ncbi:hypothetical protein ACHQM5_005649 [Ranunculus cassubicifolius]
MASSLPSCISLAIKPKRRHKSCRYHHVRAQALGDEGRSVSIVDGNMKGLRERIENIRAKERLQAFHYRTEYGWCYSPGSDPQLEKDTKSSEPLELMAMIFRSFGFTVTTTSLLLCILSIVLHLGLSGH